MKDPIDIINLINSLDRLRTDDLVATFQDGNPVPSNPLLQMKRGGLRGRVRALADRLRLAADAAEIGRGE